MKTLRPDKAGDQNEDILTAVPTATSYGYGNVNSKETNI
jgi:hypothetical protein